MKNKDDLRYPNVPSGIRPVSRSDVLPVPVFPKNYSLDSEEELKVTEEEPSTSKDPNFVPEPCGSKEPHRISQTDITDLIRDLDLPKQKAELLRSRLQQWNLLEDNVKVSVHRSRHESLMSFFKMENDLVACHDIDGVTKALGIEHIPH